MTGVRVWIRTFSPPALRAIAKALLLAMTLTACPSAAPDEVDTVVLFSIDSLRADHVGVLGYDRPTTPSIDALASRGIVFDRAYSTTSWTLPAHVSMLSGLDAEAHGVESEKSSIPRTIPLIAERAQAAGIETAGVYSGPFLQPVYGFGRGFRTYANCSGLGNDDSGIGVDWFDRLELHRSVVETVTNPCVRKRVAEWARTAPRDGKRFLFVHLWDVHSDYAPPPGYIEIFDPDYRGSTDFSNLYFNDAINPRMSERDFRHLVALYDGEIRWTDDTVAGILADLEAAGLLRRSVVVVTSDHGDEFFEHGGKTHRRTLYDEVLRVPLVVAWPGGPIQDRRSDGVVSLVDVAPAVCRWLGLACSDIGSGGPLIDTVGGRGRDDALAHLMFGFGIGSRSRVARDSKVVERPEGMIEFFGPSVYPGSDRTPTESFPQSGLSGASAAAAASVRKMDARATAAAGRARSLRPPAPQPTVAIDDATQERLKALGYLPGEQAAP